MTGRIITADEAKTLREAATEGPWCWFGNTANRSIYLATIDGGRQFVMAFYRWGMRDATPAFQGADHVMHNAEEYVQYEVAPDATDKADERLYRHDFQGLRHPDAELIAAAPDLAFTVEQQARRLEALEALFSGGPDTSCRTTWRAEGLAIAPVNVECVEVPMDDLRAAFGVTE